MLHHILTYIGGIERYGIASLCLFAAIFVGVLIWAFLQKPSHLEYMSRAALDIHPEDSAQEDPNHE